MFYLLIRLSRWSLPLLCLLFPALSLHPVLTCARPASSPTETSAFFTFLLLLIWTMPLSFPEYLPFSQSKYCSRWWFYLDFWLFLRVISTQFQAAWIVRVRCPYVALPQPVISQTLLISSWNRDMFPERRSAYSDTWNHLPRDQALSDWSWLHHSVVWLPVLWLFRFRQSIRLSRYLLVKEPMLSQRQSLLFLKFFLRFFRGSPQPSACFLRL